MHANYPTPPRPDAAMATMVEGARSMCSHGGAFIKITKDADCNIFAFKRASPDKAIHKKQSASMTQAYQIVATQQSSSVKKSKKRSSTYFSSHTLDLYTIEL